MRTQRLLNHRFWLLLALLAVGSVPRLEAQRVDIFSGVDFNFKDLNFKRQYDLLINLTPGFRWDMGGHLQLAGQVYVPIVNQYGADYGYVRPNIFVLSKQLRLGHLYLKGSVGKFSHDRYGLDLKAFLPLSGWFALEAQAGYVGLLYTWPDWYIGRPDRFAGTVGGDIYLKRWNAQLRGTAGWYLYQEYGFMAEAMRHFNHTTVSVYGCWHNTWNHRDEFDAGFRVVVMLPPYHRRGRAVTFRPASNFRLSYTVMYQPYGNVMYKTDPEENERDGWFDRDLLPWGSHTMEPDFVIEGKEVEE